MVKIHLAEPDFVDGARDETACGRKVTFKMETSDDIDEVTCGACLRIVEQPQRDDQQGLYDRMERDGF